MSEPSNPRIGALIRGGSDKDREPSFQDMYWYPFSEEEQKAWRQAEAQAAEHGKAKHEPMKFVGNLGELAVYELLTHLIGDKHTWEYVNKEAMENAQPETNSHDFRIQAVKVDVKATSDVRKFAPQAMYDASAEYIPGPAKEGFPVVDVGSDAQVFVFVLITQGETPP